MPEISTSIAKDKDLSTSPEAGRGLLRFLTCGSADDGKSALIERLLRQSKLLFDDQLSALESESRNLGAAGSGLDYALLVEGLQAEREPGIAIDVTYRFFATGRRKFIVADTSGHEHYTRNMATGASTADLAVVLVDASKGVLTQTRWHSYIVSLLGIKHVLLAVNKMDLVDHSREVFEAISEDYRAFASELDFADVACIPISALQGDNVFERGAIMGWYDGPTLIEHLKTVDIRSQGPERPFRMPVQGPVQGVDQTDPGLGGYSGAIVGGAVRPGDEIVVAPSGKTSRVSRIVTLDGDLDEAAAGQAVTLILEDDIDIKRGDVIGSARAGPGVTDQFRGHILWMGADQMLPGRSYEIRIGAQTATATVSDLRYKVNVDTLEHTAAKALEVHEIGVCNISLDRAVAFDPYIENRETGGFILIDRYTNLTVGAGLIDYGLRRATNLVWQELQIDKEARSRLKNQKPCVLWFTGLSGSGKSTVADMVEKQLHALGYHTLILDGDNVRHGLNRDLGFTDADRVENIRRIAEVSKLIVEAGLIVLVSFISPFRSERQMAHELMDDGEFLEIFIDAPLEICEARDPKGLYKKARDGKIANFTGIDSPYEAPLDPELHIKTDELSGEEAAERIIQSLKDRGIIQ